MKLWTWALVPILIGVLPLKELNLTEKHRGYAVVRWLKVAMLWIAIFLVVCGLLQFIYFLSFL